MYTKTPAFCPHSVVYVSVSRTSLYVVCRLGIVMEEHSVFYEVQSNFF